MGRDPLARPILAFLGFERVGESKCKLRTNWGSNITSGLIFLAAIRRKLL